MPNIARQKSSASQQLLRIMVYGEEKCKKSWWSLLCAQQGYNPIHLDLDDTLALYNVLPPVVSERATRLLLKDKEDRPVGWEFLTQFLDAKKPWIWDETRQIPVLTNSAVKIENVNWLIDRSKLTNRDVLIIDNWTRTMESGAFKFNIDNKINPSDALKKEWEGYRWLGDAGTFKMQQLRALPCHVIVIGHVQPYEKIKTENVNGRLVQTTEWTRIQPKSASGRHAWLLGGYFDDVYRFFRMGTAYMIDTGGDTLTMGGSRIVKAEKVSWDKWQFKNVCEAAGLPIYNPAEPAVVEAFKEFLPGENPIQQNVVEEKKPVTGNQPLQPNTGTAKFSFAKK